MNEILPEKTIGKWLLFQLLLMMVLMAIVVTKIVYDSFAQRDETIVTEENRGTDEVTLIIDYASSEQPKEIELPWNKGITLLESMKLASRRPQGIKFDYLGTGASAFLKSIGEVANGSQEGRFWQYWVNYERAAESFGTYKLEAGDQVLWKFAPEE